MKAAARIDGCVTSVMPTSGERPWTIEKTPSGIPVSRAAVRMAEAESSEVPGCAGCALTTTGQPAASAEIVSPPATEKASGKFDAPKTATGPTGTASGAGPGRGCGLRSGSARSMRAPTQEPSSISSAKSRIWLDRARALALEARRREAPVSAPARASSRSPRAIVCCAIARRNSARRAADSAA